MKKTELIHFHLKRIINYQDYTIQIGNMRIEPKNLVKWLGIWLNSKLNFKEHVEKKIANTTRVFYQIARLFNIKKTELIHFHLKRIDNYQDYIIQIDDIQIEPKNLVRWLGIWLDSKLNFKEHVEKKIADAIRVFH